MTSPMSGLAVGAASGATAGALAGGATGRVTWAKGVLLSEDVPKLTVIEGLGIRNDK